MKNLSNHLKRGRQALLGLVVLPFVLSGCGGGGGGGSSSVSFNAKPMVDNLADSIITTSYSNLDGEAQGLVTAVQTLQTTTDGTNLAAAQDAWRATRVYWESGEGYLFGPVEDLGVDPAIDSWPLNTSDLTTWLGGHATTTQTQVEAATDDVRGFHAIEYLLFGDGTDPTTYTVASLNTSKLSYLVALTQALQTKTAALKSAWTTSYTSGGSADNYATRLKSPGAGKTYASYSAVVEELVNGVEGIADEVGNGKMSEPLGTASPGDPSKEESQYSWNSLTDFHNNIQSIMNIYTGKLDFDWTSDTLSGDDHGLYEFVKAHDATLAQTVYNQIKDAQQKIALIKGDGDDTTTAITGTAVPFRTQLSTPAGRALITSAIAACNTLKDTLHKNVLPLVGKTKFTSN